MEPIQKIYIVGGGEWREKQQLTIYIAVVSPVFTFLRNPKAAAVKQSLECSPRMRKVGCSYPDRHRPKSLKQVVVSSPAECSSGNRLGCYRFLNMTLKRMSNMYHSRCCIAKEPSLVNELVLDIGLNLKLC